MKSIHHRVINEDRFLSRPANSVRAIVPCASMARCLADLADRGFGDRAVHVLEGEEGRRILDVRGRNHGVRGRIVRLYQGGGAEGNELQTMNAALQHGHAVFIVAVRDQPQMLLAARAMLDCGGDRIFHYDKRGSQLLA